MDGRSGAELNPTGTWVTSTRHVQGQARHSRAEIQTECSLLAFRRAPSSWPLSRRCRCRAGCGSSATPPPRREGRRGAWVLRVSSDFTSTVFMSRQGPQAKGQGALICQRFSFLGLKKCLKSQNQGELHSRKMCRRWYESSLSTSTPVGEPSELVRRGESERKRESVEKHAWEGSPIALMYRCECLHVRICTHMHTCGVCTHMCFSACTCEYGHTRARVRCHVDECTCMCTHVV